MKVAFINPKIRLSDLWAMYKSIRSTWLVYGKYTNLLEERLSQFLGAGEVVATSSCTTALQLALHLSNVGEGDEVITTPISWVATANVIIHAGAKPVFVDIDPRTGLIDLALIESSITPRTKAVLFVDLFGQVPDLHKLRMICDKYNLSMIEDAAHALESESDGAHVGEVSDFAAFSFHSAKNITSGQGGALKVNSLEIANRAKVLRRDGVVNLPDGKRRMIELGYKYDSTDFQSAMLLNQIKRIPRNQLRRKAVLDTYLSGLDPKYVQVIPQSSDNKLSFHLVVILVDAEIRDELRGFLLKRGIQTSVHYEAIHLEPYYRDLLGTSVPSLPHSESFGRCVISLPTYPGLSRRKQKYVIDQINNFFVTTHK